MQPKILNLFDDEIESYLTDYQQVNFNVVAHVFALYRKGENPYDISKSLMGLEKNGRITPDISVNEFQEALEVAESAGEYFSKKLTLRSLQGKKTSEWDRKISLVFGDTTKFRKRMKPVYVTLPQIYYDNLLEDQIMQGAKSYNSPRKAEIPPTRVRYVDTVKSRSSEVSGKKHFFISEQGHLFYVISQDGGSSAAFIDAIAKPGSEMTVQGKFNCHVYPGYDIKVLQFVNKRAEITDLKVQPDGR